MSFLSKLANGITGGLGQLCFDAVKTYLPPSMTEQEKENMRLALQQIELKKKNQADKAIGDAEQRLTARIKELEGSAKDLLSMPLVGRLVLFLRGCQRPVWGYATLYLDWQWFSAWTLNEQQQTALTVINFLVLGFLFGERAIANVMPLVTKMFMAKASN